MKEHMAKLRESFWFIPAVLGVVALVLAQALVSLDRYLLDTRVDLTGSLLYHVGASGSRDILGAIGGSMLGVAATSFSITISVLATASSSYGPRLVRNFMADRGNQVVLGIFGATFLYSLMVLRSIRSIESDGSVFVPDIAVNVAVALAVVDVGVLVYFIHHIAQSIQVATLSGRVRDELSASVDALYPPEQPADAASAEGIVKPPVYTTVLAEESGVIIDIDEDAVLNIAGDTDTDTVIDVHRVPGEHVVAGEPLADVLADRSANISADAVGRVRGSFTIGTSRTPRHDIAFAVEQMTEMAVRALSTGVNDPYTARNAIDDLTVGLVAVVQRPRPSRARCGSDGTVRVITRRVAVPSLIDHALDAVRIYGTGSPMVVQAGIRLAERVGRAAHDSENVDAVLTQLDLLDRALASGDTDTARTAEAREQISLARAAITDRVPLAVPRVVIR
ncbi:DUF2254 domain-containing protein [Rhodococcus sp. IEGM 1401]|uniref:DUF2254 domain-containing protein n=2 Tax=Rhodococcus TaxID=1827 RepID=UPI0022B42AD0|nr:MULTISPECIES: DUF2254 domain-containing protein [unclassified Rhodococcus (in: high G+C Gram-positive bacteria)]MCZ4562378.1 DUF2254 domain-containing protein [Rhodococcus sp. IEGM 1401]MDI9922420.1 DUF2254 domain-containing protein [Rhodococcus sp. IEGM 1372]MDV8034970.1 DUF2254 domain-containing protein [Rhodococcus sp. IEGM 1414]